MTKPEPATTGAMTLDTEVGSVFVSNYPPFSFWDEEHMPAIDRVLAAPPHPQADFGIYLHIPFCRKRCKFCYFRVFTDKNSSEIGSYVDALGREIELYATMPAIAGRRPKFVYFGGGTPSFIRASHLQALVDRAQAAIPWTGVEEVSFECEPGTLTETKVHAIKDIGVTRLSLGIENFDDEILRENGRAHLSKEIGRCMPWIEAAGFEQLNIDLIAGMVGERWETWRETVAKTVDMMADSVTIYQMELPFNTRYSGRILDGTFDTELATWETKRAWQDYAFEELAKVGYEVSSAYTMVRSLETTHFVYRDAVWDGCDMLGTGVASFSHLSGVHFQNVDGWGEYLASLRDGRLPLGRALPTTDRDRLIRELILQLKRGYLEVGNFQTKFGVKILEEFARPFAELAELGMLELADDSVRLTRRGLLQVDTLLPKFYDRAYHGARYT
ncbi:MAG: coproporphyrinogen-III oxidase family protein [Acidobacteria bacterium]|nr:coproporphyrinogen-III oxidase family protein [Acidobacteriota bacterium]